MRALKVVAGLLAILIAAFVVVTVYGVREQIYRCDAGLVPQAGVSPVYFKLDLYRPFILWSGSDGTMRYEIPPSTIGLFVKVKKTDPM